MNHYSANISTAINNNIVDVNKPTRHKYRKVKLNKQQNVEKKESLYDIQKSSYKHNNFSLETKFFENKETNKIIIKRTIQWKENNMTKKRIELQEFNVD